ncbi:hypothetical protein LCGC14_1953350, partial [marine sediment metagenome]
LEDSNYPAFDTAAVILRRRGFSVLNPAETDAGSSDRPRSFYLRVDIANLLRATKIVILPGWEGSPGATLEVAIARELGLEVLTYPDLEPLSETIERPTRASVFPKTAEGRKQRPVASGVLDYFPDALVEIAHVSWVGNDQHNPGECLHWARGKSTDEADALIRHFLQRGGNDTDGARHSAKMAWRALALLQKEIERDRESA